MSFVLKPRINFLTSGSSGSYALRRIAQSRWTSGSLESDTIVLDAAPHKVLADDSVGAHIASVTVAQNGSREETCEIKGNAVLAENSRWSNVAARRTTWTTRRKEVQRIEAEIDVNEDHELAY